MELYQDLLSLYEGNDAAADPTVLRRLIGKLQLMEITDLTQESLALFEMVSASGEDPGKSIEKMSMLLKKIKDFVQTENPEMNGPAKVEGSTLRSAGEASADGNHKAPIIPDDFRCPISVELMKDPVIVSTGQVKGCAIFSLCDALKFACMIAVRSTKLGFRISIACLTLFHPVQVTINNKHSS